MTVFNVTKEVLLTTLWEMLVDGALLFGAMYWISYGFSIDIKHAAAIMCGAFCLYLASKPWN